MTAINLAITCIIVAAALVTVCLIGGTAVISGLLQILRHVTAKPKPRPLAQPLAAGKQPAPVVTRDIRPPAEFVTEPILPQYDTPPVTPAQVCETFSIGDREIRALVKAGLLQRSRPDSRTDLTLTGESYRRLLAVRQSNTA